MDNDMTGAVIKRLRERKRMTQAQLAARIGVSPKTVSKWETARGLPDISLLDTLAAALDISVSELMKGDAVVNRNVSASVLRTRLYVCPVCGNILHSMGEAVVSCCGVALPPLEAREPDEAHALRVERVEDQWFVSVPHEMTRDHYISFLAYATSDRFQLVKLYPEGGVEGRFTICGHGCFYLYCSRHGLMARKV